MRKNSQYVWKDADTETRKRWVRVLRQDLHSDKVIADFFCVTKGAVVGFRHRHLPELNFGQKAIRPQVNLDRFRDLLEIDAMRQLEAAHRNVRAIAPVTAPAPQPVSETKPTKSVKPLSAVAEMASIAVSRRLANAFNQCQFTGGCAYERLPGRNDCGRPGHDK